MTCLHLYAHREWKRFRRVWRCNECGEVSRGTYHEHDYQLVGYGGAGWSLYRCACGETEIDA